MNSMPIEYKEGEPFPCYYGCGATLHRYTEDVATHNCQLYTQQLINQDLSALKELLKKLLEKLG